MVLALQDKKKIVAELKQWADTSVSAVVADYRGLTANAMLELRSTMREGGVKMRVCRNTLLRLAVDGTSFSCLGEVLMGPVAVFFSLDEPGAAARILRAFISSNADLKPRAIALGGVLLPEEKLELVADLPSREEALSRLAYVMTLPMSQLACTLNELIVRLLRTLLVVREQRG